MNMDGMLPAARTVLQDPVLDCVLLDAKTNLIEIHELSVDLPLAVAPLELERPNYPRRPGRTWQRVVLRISRGVDAVVRHSGLVHHNLHYPVSLACGQHIAGWPAPVGLLEPVFQIERLAGKRGEIEDDVAQFGHTQSARFKSDRARQKVSVVGDLPEQIMRVQD